LFREKAGPLAGNAVLESHRTNREAQAEQDGG
jgi:hypothetical protein